MTNRKREDGEIAQFAKAMFTIYALYLLLLYFTNKTEFWFWVIGGAGIIALISLLIFWFRKYMEHRKIQRMLKIVDKVKDTGMEEYVKNFIIKFGVGHEKTKSAWKRWGYTIELHRIKDLQEFLKEKGVALTLSDLNLLLTHFIKEREYAFTTSSIGVIDNKFRDLDGAGFEKLLYRLYEAMGYSVQLCGRTGDQGGDLVAVKGQESLLVQAKCYQSESVGNKAIQEAVAAKNHYDCNKAAVVTNSNFTREAIALAKTNGVDLIPKAVLQKMLIDHLHEGWS